MTKVKVGGARRSRTVVIAAVTVIALVAVVLVAYQLGRSGGGAAEAESDRGTSTEGATSTSSGSKTTSESEPESAADQVVPPYEDWSVPPARVSALPASTEQVEGYEVGFPGTTLGAVAWTVASYEAMTTTSSEALLAAATAYYPEEWTGEAPASRAAEIQEGVSSIIEDFGYSDDADLASEVFGYVVRSETENRVVIATAVAIRGEEGDDQQTVYGAIITAAEWDGERWNGVVREDPSIDLSPGQLTAVEPGSAEFNQQGWYAINRENWS